MHTTTPSIMNAATNTEANEYHASILHSDRKSHTNFPRLDGRSYTELLIDDSRLGIVSTYNMPNLRLIESYNSTFTLRNCYPKPIAEIAVRTSTMFHESRVAIRVSKKFTAEQTKLVGIRLGSIPANSRFCGVQFLAVSFEHSDEFSQQDATFTSCYFNDACTFARSVIRGATFEDCTFDCGFSPDTFKFCTFINCKFKGEAKSPFHECTFIEKI